MNNFSFSHSVFKRLVSGGGGQKVSLCGNGLSNKATGSSYKKQKICKKPTLYIVSELRTMQCKFKTILVC